MAQSQNHPRGGCVAVDGGDGWHRERNQLGYHRLEQFHHVCEALAGFGLGTGGMSPG